MIPSERLGGTGLSYSRGQADGFDEIIVLRWSGEFQQHDVVYSQAHGSLSIVRVDFHLSHGDVLTDKYYLMAHTASDSPDERWSRGLKHHRNLQFHLPYYN